MITEAVLNMASREPGRTSIIHNGTAISYSALANAIGRARAFFKTKGYVGQGTAVLAVSHLVDFWVSSVALRSLGLTTVAIASTNDLHLLGIPDVRGLVTAPNETWPGLQAFCAGNGWDLLSLNLTGLEPDVAPDLSGPAGGHILRTSGTTGTYKKVLLDPEIDQLSIERRQVFQPLTRDSVCNGFDYGPWTAAGYAAATHAFMVGAAVIFQQTGNPLDALRIPGQTHAAMLPEMLTFLLSAPEGAYARNEGLQLTIGGGAVTWAGIERAKMRITPHVFLTIAGTEMGAIAFTRQEKPEDVRWHRLLANRRTELVDDDDMPVAVGQVGRVRVAADGGPVAYLHDEDSTREFFKDGYFYPGDLAVMCEDGRMALQGRVTDVLNIEGQKVSPLPVEESVRSVFGLTALCLVSLPDQNGVDEIFVVVEGGTPADPHGLVLAVRDALRTRAPVHLAVTGKMPRTGTGKIIRHEVRAGLTKARGTPTEA